MSQKTSKNSLGLTAKPQSHNRSSKPYSSKSKWLKRGASLATYGLLFMVVYSVANWWRQPVMPANPNLHLTDYQGQQVNIKAMSQHAPVLVYFWGSWCGVCKVTSPKINSLAQSSPYPVVTIAVQSGNNTTLAHYLQQRHFNFITVNDNNGDIFTQWQGQVTPSYVIIKNGKMTQGLTGIQPEWSLRLRLWLASLT